MTKKALRKQLRAQRKILSLTERKRQSISLMHNALTTISLSYKNHIGIYFATQEEIDTQPFISHLLQAEQYIYLPTIDNDILSFYSYKKNSQLITNQYHIKEPDKKKETYIEIENIHILFMPLVGFDSSGYRLGMGGGYYDKTLGSKSEYQNNCKLVGLAYDIQEVPIIPREKHDIRLDLIVTPTRIIKPK